MNNTGYIHNKKSTMCIAALLILIFHLWSTTRDCSTVELFLVKTGYIGVDLFFLLSASSLSKRKIENYGSFVGSRFKVLYPKFVLFSLIYILYKKKSFLVFLKIITFMEFFKKGGGSFLWFIPAILIFYMIIPLFQRCDFKNRKLTIVGSIVIYIALAILFTSYHKPLMIIINRIPILLIGYYIQKLPVYKPEVIGWACLVVGIYLAYRYGFNVRAEKPFYNMYYIYVIPYVVGVTILSSRIPSNPIIELVGSATLEIYALQMIFGFKLATVLYSAIGIRMVSNLVTVVVVLLISILYKKLYDLVQSSITKRIKTS